MKNNLRAILCLLIVLSGTYMPEQHAAQSQNSNYSWAIPAFVGVGVGFFLGSWFMKRNLRQEINDVRNEGRRTRRCLINLNNDIIHDREALLSIHENYNDYTRLNNRSVRAINERIDIHNDLGMALNRRINTTNAWTAIHFYLRDTLPRIMINLFIGNGNNHPTNGTNPNLPD